MTRYLFDCKKENNEYEEDYLSIVIKEKYEKLGPIRQIIFFDFFLKIVRHFFCIISAGIKFV